MATYNFNKLIDRAKGRRIPKEQHLMLAALDWAALMLDLEPGRVGEEEAPRVQRLADYLMKAAKFYYQSMDHVATLPRRPGRPDNRSDPAFIFVMAMGYGPAIDREITFRRYKAPSAGEIGGKEQPTRFQQECNSWMEMVDPDRPKPLQPAAFKQAGLWWRHRRV